MGLYDTTFGTLLVSILLNTFLYGLVTYQFAVYHLTKFNDPPMTRYMVFFLFVLDSFHSISVIYMTWNYAVTNLDNPAALALPEVAEWPHTISPLATALAALVTQIYLGIRIWRLTRSKFLYGIVILLAIPSFILGIATSIEAWIIRVFSEFFQFIPLTVAWLFTQVAVDTYITITLVIVFSRSRTGFLRTDTILNRFIRGAIQTGLFADIFSLGDLITFAASPDKNFFAIFGIPLGRIYTNTLMDTLLSREMLIVKTDGVVTVTRAMQVDSVFWPPNDSQAIPTVQTARFQLPV